MGHAAGRPSGRGAPADSAALAGLPYAPPGDGRPLQAPGQRRTGPWDRSPWHGGLSGQLGRAGSSRGEARTCPLPAAFARRSGRLLGFWQMRWDPGHLCEGLSPPLLCPTPSPSLPQSVLSFYIQRIIHRSRPLKEGALKASRVARDRGNSPRRSSASWMRQRCSTAFKGTLVQTQDSPPRGHVCP